MLVELHCHSNRSDGVPTVREIMHKADSMLDGIAISDHNTMRGYREAEKIKSSAMLIPAVEITCHHGKHTGHILALGIEEFKRGNVFDVLDFIKSNGGVSIVSHPFRGLGYSFNDKEIWKKADAIEVLNGNTLMLKNMKAYQQAKIMKKPMTAGSDAHWLRFVGSYACEVKADNVDTLLKRIKQGRVILPDKSTSIFRILFYGTARKSKLKLQKVLGSHA